MPGPSKPGTALQAVPGAWLQFFPRVGPRIHDGAEHPAAINRTIVMHGTRSRIAALDLLRALAALAVLAHHWNWSLSAGARSAPFYPESMARHGGFYGTSLFFVISGFVILRSARGATAEQFVVNRAIRLYPAFWICCSITWIATRDGPMGKTFVEYLFNLTMFPQVFGMPMVDGVYWTLAVEAKFYLLIAAVIAFGSLARVELVLWAWLASACIPAGPVVSDLLMAPYAPFFTGGCACLLIGERASAPRLMLFAGSVVAGMVVAVDQARQIGLLFHAPPQALVAAAMVAGFFLLVLAIATDRWRLRQGRLVITAGAISYPLYLLHSELGRKFHAMASGLSDWTFYATGLAGMLLIAWCVTTWVEMPARRWLVRLRDGRQGTAGRADGNRAIRVPSSPSAAAACATPARAEQDSGLP